MIACLDAGTFERIRATDNLTDQEVRHVAECPRCKGILDLVRGLDVANRTRRYQSRTMYAIAPPYLQWIALAFLVLSIAYVALLLTRERTLETALALEHERASDCVRSHAP